MTWYFWEVATLQVAVWHELRDAPAAQRRRRSTGCGRGGSIFSPSHGGGAVTMGCHEGWKVWKVRSEVAKYMER